MENEIQTVAGLGGIDLQARYYTNDGANPKNLPEIIQMIRADFAEMDKISAMAMLDLFFLHKNWKTLYSRKDSFRAFLKNDLQISKSHAYDIIRSIKSLYEYFSDRGMVEKDLLAFYEDITQSVEKLGVTKLIKISHIPRKENRIELLDKLLGGDDLKNEDLQEGKYRQKRARKKSLRWECAIGVDGKASCTFTNDTDDMEFTPDELASVEAVITGLLRKRGLC